MNIPKETLIIGIGSDFGDDRVGLVIAEVLSARLPACAVLRLRSPVAVLDHLGHIKQLHIIDACKGAGPPGKLARYDWPIADGIEIQFHGTHDFGLLAALQLAEVMGLLPPQVTIWSIEIADSDLRQGFSQPLSSAVARGAKLLVDQVVNEITTAVSHKIEQLPHA